MDTRAYKNVYKKAYSRLGFRLLACTIVIEAVQIAIALFMGASRLGVGNNINIRLAALMIPTYALAYPCAFLIMGDSEDKCRIEKHRMTAAHFFVAFLMSYALMFAGNLVGIGVTSGIGFLKGEPVTNDLSELINSTNIWLTSIYTVLLAPVFEELLFRKMLCDSVVKFGQGTAILLSGLTFGLFHGNFNQFFYAFFLGCFLAFIYVKTGNIKYTIGLHMLINFVGSVVGGLLLQNVDLSMDIENMSVDSLLIMSVYSVLIYCIVIAGTVLLLIYRSRMKVDEGILAYDKSLRNRAAFLNAGMILYIVCYTLMILFQAFFE